VRDERPGAASGAAAEHTEPKAKCAIAGSEERAENTAKPSADVLMPLVFEPALCFERGLAAGAGSRDRLAVIIVLDIA